MNFFRTHKREVLIFLLAILLRLIYLFISINVQNGNVVDAVAGADYYYVLSKNIIAGRGFSSSGHFPYIPNSYRTPLWPYFIAFIYTITGSYLGVALVEVIIGSLLPIIAMRIAGLMFNSSGLITAVGLFLAVEPYSILFSTFFYSETFFILIFSLFILYLFRYFKENKISLLATSGFLLGLATLTKAVAQYIPFFIVPIIFWNFGKKNLKESFYNSAIFGFVFMVTLSPWIYRNYLVFNTFGLSSQANVQFYQMLVPSTLAVENDTSWGEEYHKLLNNGEGVVDVNKSNIVDTKNYLKKSIPILMEHKAALTVLSANTALNFFIHDGLYDVLRHVKIRPDTGLRKPALFLLVTSPREIFFEIRNRITEPEILILFARIFWVGLFIAFLYGLFRYYRKNGLDAYWLSALGLTGYFMVTTLSIGLAVNARYRMPINIFIIMFASYGITQIFASNNINNLSDLQNFLVSLFSRYAKVFRFLISGGLAFLVNIIALYLFRERVGMSLNLAVPSAFIVGFIVSFLMMKYFTFQDRSTTGGHRQLVSYLGVSLFNLGLNSLLVHTFVNFVNYIFAQTISSLLIAVSSFFVYKNFIFNEALSTGPNSKKIDVRRKIPFFIVISAVTLAFYMPFWMHVLDIRDIQIRQNLNSREILPIYGSDSIGYGLLGDSLVERGIFSASSDVPLKPDTFRTIGYPGMLAIHKYIFGSYKFFPLVQIVFVILTALFIYKIGTKIFSERVGIIASFLYVFDPTTILFALTINSDVPFAFFLILSLYCLFFRETKSLYLASGLGGLFLGIATLVRPISMFLPILLLPIYLYINKGNLPFKNIARGALLFLAMFFFAVTPWMIRNKIVSNSWDLSSVKDFNFFQYTMPEYISFQRGVGPDDIRREMYEELRLKGVDQYDAADLENTSILNDISHRYFKENMLGYPKWHAVKMVPFFLSSGMKNFFYTYNAILGYTVYETNNSNLTNFLMKGQIGEFFKVLKGQFIITAEQIFWVIIFLSMFVPILDKKRRIQTLLLLAVVFYLALPTVPVAYSRFRIPASPYMFILATAGVLILKDFLMNRLQKNK